MSESNRSRNLVVLGVLAVLVLGAAVAGLVIGAGQGKTTGGDTDKPGTSAGAGQDAAADLAAWAAMTGGEDLIIKAEEAKGFEGLMVLAEGTAGGSDDAGAKFVWVPDGTCGKDEDDSATNKAVFQLDVENAGAYYPWARVWWTDGCGNSVRVWLEREGPEPIALDRTDGNYEVWQWVPLMSANAKLELEQGAYKVTVENREDGARVSRILFSSKPYKFYTPTTPEG